MQRRLKVFFVVGCLLALVMSSLFFVMSITTPSAHAGAPDESQVKQYYYVDQNSGNDGNPGTQSQPFQTINRAMSAAQTSLNNGVGTKIVIAPGMYRERIETIQNNDTVFVIEGTQAGQVIISGSDIYAPSEWTNEGNNVYSHPWNYNFGFFDGTSGSNNVPFILGHRREMVFINDQRLQQAMIENWTYTPPTDYWSGTGSWSYNSYIGPSALSDNTFGVSEPSSGAGLGKLFVKVPGGFDFAHAKIEVATRGQEIYIRKNNVVLRNIVVQHSTDQINNGQAGVMVNKDSSWQFLIENHLNNVLLENVEARWNNADGLYISGAKGNIYHNISLHDNGANGASISYLQYSTMDTVTVTNNQWRVRQQNEAPSPGTWWIAGIKIAWCSKYNTFTNLNITNNKGPGFWTDGNNFNNTFQNSTFSNNWKGLMFEVSEGPQTVTNSTMTNNVFDGLLIYQSRHVTLENSVVRNNGMQVTIDGYHYDRTIDVPDEYRGPDYEGGVMYTDYVTLMNNVIASSQGANSHLIQSNGSTNNWDTRVMNHLTADYNLYYNTASTSQFPIDGNSYQDLSAWQNRLKAANTGQSSDQEAHSRWDSSALTANPPTMTPTPTPSTPTPTPSTPTPTPTPPANGVIPIVSASTTATGYNHEYLANSYDGVIANIGSYQCFLLMTNDTVTYNFGAPASLTSINLAPGVSGSGATFDVQVLQSGTWSTVLSNAAFPGTPGSFTNIPLRTPASNVQAVKLIAHSDWEYIDEIQFIGGASQGPTPTPTPRPTPTPTPHPTPTPTPTSRVLAMASASTTATGYNHEYLANSYDGVIANIGSYQCFLLMTNDTATYNLSAPATVQSINIAPGVSGSGATFNVQVLQSGTWSTVVSNASFPGTPGSFTNIPLGRPASNVQAVKIIANNDWEYIDEIQFIGY